MRWNFFKVASFSAAVELPLTTLPTIFQQPCLVSYELKTESEKETFGHLIPSVDIHLIPYEEGGKDRCLEIKDFHLKSSFVELLQASIVSLSNQVCSISACELISISHDHFEIPVNIYKRASPHLGKEWCMRVFFMS